MTLLRKLHTYAALATFVNLMVFGIVGIWAALEPRLTAAPPTELRY